MGQHKGSTSGPFALAFPPELVDAIAQRAAELLREQSIAEAFPAYLTTSDAANYFRASRQRIFDLTSQGRLKVCKDGSRNLYRKRDLDAYLSGEAA